MNANFNLRQFAQDCIARNLTKSEAKVELERIGQSGLRSQLSPIMRELRGEAKPRPNYAQRRAAKALATAEIDNETPEQSAAMVAAFVACHDALIAAGAMLDAESDHGSRYYTLATCKVRVADHAATAGTRHWLDGIDSKEIRVDRRNWRSALEQIIERA